MVFHRLFAAPSLNGAAIIRLSMVVSMFSAPVMVSLVISWDLVVSLLRLARSWVWLPVMLIVPSPIVALVICSLLYPWLVADIVVLPPG